MGLENTFDGFPAEGNYSSAITMDFLGGVERTAIKDPPRPLRLARPPAGHFAGFAEFDEEEPGTLVAHQSQKAPAENFPRNNVEHIVSTADSRDDEYDERREVTKKGSDGNNVRRGKKRLSDFKKLKHSDARLPEVTSLFPYSSVFQNL